MIFFRVFIDDFCGNFGFFFATSKINSQYSLAPGGILLGNPFQMVLAIRSFARGGFELIVMLVKICNKFAF